MFFDDGYLTLCNSARFFSDWFNIFSSRCSDILARILSFGFCFELLAPQLNLLIFAVTAFSWFSFVYFDLIWYVLFNLVSVQFVKQMYPFLC